MLAEAIQANAEPHDLCNTACGLLKALSLMGVRMVGNRENAQAAPGVRLVEND